MFCIGLLALAIIFIIALFTKMLNAATKGGNLSVATYVASAELDKLSYSPQSLQAVMTQGGTFNTQTTLGGGTISLNRTTFSIRDTVAALGSATNAAANLYYVDVQVSWYEHENEVGGTIQRNLDLNRLIYETPFNQ